MSSRIEYRAYPLAKAHPAFAETSHVWQPILSVRVNNPAKHTPPTARFEAWVDSGSPFCYFHADLGRAIGLKVEKGIKDQLGGIIKGAPQDVYFHDIGLWVGVEMIKIRAAFSDHLSVAGILGRTGFFSNFVVTFDHSGTPPAFTLERIRRT